MAFFSVIVPIYGVEKYIRPCLDSVLSQGYEDLELILVDDGSKDRCPQICDDYAAKDRRVVVVHKANDGLSNARNSGMARATGRYLIFLDGDDFLLDGVLGRLHKALTAMGERDMVFTKLHDYYEGRGLVRTTGHFNVTDREKKEGMAHFADFIKAGVEVWSASSVIYLRAFLEGHQLTFQKALIGAEDMDFYFEALIRAERFGAYEEGVVCYRRQREGSIITNPKAAIIAGQFHVREKWYRKVAQMALPTSVKNQVMDYLATDCLKKYHKLTPYKGAERQALAAAMAQCFYMVRAIRSLSPKHRLMRGIYRVLGVDKGVRAMGPYYGLKKVLNRRPLLKGTDVASE